ncbi:hypothetical protein PC129_g20908 [Phytophthora cactorum]|uniref:Uncharacterized protein n=2 Tax=Phytophthora cactorum TaxID=29920 RepID=A0A8T1H7M5_9STRA|nr:hypothetical protein Pcac1_g26570 [Phytophthora cactorum]KAG2832499.1 hypothetical protein PC112_g6884 [Phytophthora cactorum]KAG2834553.1 hypothetical protein PC111_g5800 [Phytophthora cactorum]KAG2861663.1 hypothetical protein PC113_g6976 [Phytophthora cactorum]KAG2917971.1 hypothetical protein PC114_g6967 [Phytophthora cactorum]
MTASLMRLRYETYSSKFLSARNNAMIRAVWLLLAGDLSKEHEVLISSDQCKNKIKGLKRKWAEYCSELSSTGNNVDKPIVEATCLALMEEFWSRGTGMQGDTLADNDTTGDLLDSDSDDDTRVSTINKSKTVAEGLEIGMKATSSGFHAVASAMSSQQSAINSSPPQRLESAMEARFATVIDQLQTQNNNLAALVEFLRKQ